MPCPQAENVHNSKTQRIQGTVPSLNRQQRCHVHLGRSVLCVAIVLNGGGRCWDKTEVMHLLQLKVPGLPIHWLINHFVIVDLHNRRRPCLATCFHQITHCRQVSVVKHQVIWAIDAVLDLLAWVFHLTSRRICLVLLETPSAKCGQNCASCQVLPCFGLVDQIRPVAGLHMDQHIAVLVQHRAFTQLVFFQIQVLMLHKEKVSNRVKPILEKMT